MVRKAHRKSRSGCLVCKRRRIKCDEQKPSCQKCIARDATCKYPTKPLVWVSRNATDDEQERQNESEPSLPAYSLVHRKDNPSPSNDPLLNLENIDLIIQWFTKTIYTVNSASNQRALKISQTVIMEQAMRHHFLLHGILALSALHLADHHPDRERYIKVATTHHTKGLALYHGILSNMDESNYSASIAFSSLITMFAFGISKPEPNRGMGSELLDDLAQILLLGKGWYKVVHVAELHCKGGSPLLSSPESNSKTLCPDTENAFDRLHALNQGNDAATYKVAISALKSVFVTLDSKPNDDPHIALEWVNNIPEEFLRLISERKRLALVILGYYCVVLDWAPHVWWLRGWSKGLFGVVWMSVDGTHQDVLKWPMQMIGNTNETSV